MLAMLLKVTASFGKNNMWSQPSRMASRTFYQATDGVDEIEEVS